jgi:hypothetical protein
VIEPIHHCFCLCGLSWFFQNLFGFGGFCRTVSDRVLEKMSQKVRPMPSAAITESAALIERSFFYFNFPDRFILEMRE